MNKSHRLCVICKTPLRVKCKEEICSPKCKNEKQLSDLQLENLKEYNIKAPYVMDGKHRVIIISDLHEPYAHPLALDHIKRTQDKWKCETVVCIGDEADQHGMSNWPKHASMPNPTREYELLMIKMQRWYNAFPNVKVCISNHTARPYRKATDAGIPSIYLKNYQEIMQAPKGWSWHQRIKIDGVAYEHGELVSGQNGASQAARDNGCNTVIGHIHGFGGVYYIGTPFNTIWGLNTGCLFSPDHLSAKYGEKYRKKATLGCGVVIDGLHAYFERLVL